MAFTNTIPAEQLRALLEEIIRTMPDLKFSEELREEDLRWLSRAEVLLEASGAGADVIDFRVARKMLGSYNHDRSALLTLLLNCYYRAELRAPPAAQGSFIPPGDTWRGYAALVKLVEQESDDLLIVDPYLDATVYTDILPHAVARKSIRCLTVKGAAHTALVATQQKWLSDPAMAKRHVELRYAPKPDLHDRLVFVDGVAWDISQSLKDLAKRSAASVAKAESEMGKLKLAHYETLWTTSGPLTP